jgi:hypothetical protein
MVLGRNGTNRWRAAREALFQFQWCAKQLTAGMMNQMSQFRISLPQERTGGHLELETFFGTDQAHANSLGVVSVRSCGIGGEVSQPISEQIAGRPRRNRFSSQRLRTPEHPARVGKSSVSDSSLGIPRSVELGVRRNAQVRVL